MVTATLNPPAKRKRFLDMTIEERERDFEIWARDVRDYAKYHSEGPRRITFGPCRFEYEISPLADGRFAARSDRMTGHSGGCSPWTAFPTREAALESVLEEARQTYRMSSGGCITNADKINGPKMLTRLDAGTLFGFEEPDPLSRDEWYPEMIADQIGSMTMYVGWDILDVVRDMTNAPCKSGSFFDIPLPECWKQKGRLMGVGNANDDPDDEDDDSPLDE